MSHTQAQIQAPLSKKYEKKMYRTRDESIFDTTATLTMVSNVDTKNKTYKITTQGKGKIVS